MTAEEKLEKLYRVVKGMKENKEYHIQKHPDCKTKKSIETEIFILGIVEGLLTNEQELNDWLRIVE